MGACRGANLLLGISTIPAMVSQLWFIALLPVLYIATITMISRGEVYGGEKKTLTKALFFYIIVVISVLALGFLPQYKLMYIYPFLLLFLYLTLVPLLKAFINPNPIYIRKAVKGCVIALIALDATMAVGFAGWLFGVLVICLLPFSLGMAKVFSVT